MAGTVRAAWWLTVIGLFLIESSHGQEAPNIPDVESIKERVKAVYEDASPAVVRFSYGKDGRYHFGCGVIVTPEGHVAVSGPVHAVLQDALLDLRLVDGRRVAGKALGWSSEFGFGLLKLTEEGPWPYVDLRERRDAQAGEFCVALGYPRNPLDNLEEPHLGIRLGVVTRSAPPYWFTSSHRIHAGAHGVFDLDGKLLGLNSRQPGGRDPVQTCAALIKSHWDELMAGKNLDRTRLHALDPSHSVTAHSQAQLPGKEELANSVIEKATAACVRMSEIGQEEVLVSGVIVTPDGYVITCGHHERLPGHKVKVALTNGRDADAVVLGTNLICDIGLMKIVDEGPWPHSPLGDSTMMRAGDHCVLIGYPNARPGRQPWVSETQLTQPTHTLPRKDEWYREFWTSGFPESLPGTSGGGVFDQHGRVVGVLLGGVSGEGGQRQHARVELFRKQWDFLATAKFGVVDSDWLAVVKPICKQIAEDVSAESQE